MKSIILLLMVIPLLFQFHSSFIIVSPIKPIVETVEDPIKKALTFLGAPIIKLHDLTSAINLASQQTKISPYLLASLCYTESTFNYKAKSNKGYVGLMQTPWASKKWADLDVLHGARILEEKLKLSNNDLELALTLYKGGRNEMAKRQARETMIVYNRLLDRMRG
jgi:hypothetical protein